MPVKKKIAFLTGGYSGEAEISYLSAKQIQANLDTGLFDIYRIDIRKDGWFYQQAGVKEIAVNRADFTIVTGEELLRFDAVFIGIHGTPGEDGKLQAYFDLLGIPYTGCDATTSALTFNKRYTVAVASMAGIQVARSLHFFKTDSLERFKEATRLRYPLFIKPNNGGSSIGMSKINTPGELNEALEKAFHEDDQVLAEEYIAGREFTIGVFKSGHEIVTLPMTEVLTEKDFFDYEAKYKGKSKEITPANASEDIARKVQETATKIYQVFNCRGVVRIDFIYEEATQQPYMLEINTVPGQSEASIVPQQLRAMGLTLKEFYTKLIEECFI
jgi:D-alanine-D-alanine ligase